MKVLIVLSKENTEMACFEVESISNLKNKELVENYLLGELTNPEIDAVIKRIAYSRGIYEVLFRCNSIDLLDRFSKYDWQTVYEKSFSVRRMGDIEYSEKQLAGYIWDRVEKPKVDLRDAGTKIVVFFVGDEAIVTKKISDINQKFEARKAHKRPRLHPTTLNPKIARAMINFSGAKIKILDPFCGGGGILIEAGLMGIKSVGIDLYEEMIKRAKLNLEYFGIKNCELICDDALLISKKYDYVVTDIPYGMNTAVWVKSKDGNLKVNLKKDDNEVRLKNLEEFYLAFLVNLRKILGKRAVIIFPHYVKYKSLIRKAGFKIEREFSQYIHRSLTRKITIIS